MQYQSSWRARNCAGYNFRVKLAIQILFAGLVIWFLFSAVAVAMDKQEKKDCLIWQEYAQKYPLFEASAENIELCKTRGVLIK